MKKLADTPEALWSEAEIKLYAQQKADLPVVQSQGDSASDKQEKKAEVATADDKTADDKTAEEEEEEIYEPGRGCVLLHGSGSLGKDHGVKYGTLNKHKSPPPACSG